MEAVNLKKKECKIVVAVDESEESMYALSWCLGNLFSQNTTNTLVLLYVKPPPPVYSSFDAAGLQPLLVSFPSSLETVTSFLLRESCSFQCVVITLMKNKY